MAERLIRKYGDEVLRKKSREVNNISKNILMLLDDMAETMHNGDGVGLAGPQVGILRRVVTIDVGEGVIEMINPEIIEVSEEKEISVEGCLSVPGKWGEVERPYKVKAKATNREGKEFIIEGEGLLARAICHELDHLDGYLFIDKVIKFVDIKNEEK